MFSVICVQYIIETSIEVIQRFCCLWPGNYAAIIRWDVCNYYIFLIQYFNTSVTFISLLDLNHISVMIKHIYVLISMYVILYLWLICNVNTRNLQCHFQWSHSVSLSPCQCFMFICNQWNCSNTLIFSFQFWFLCIQFQICFAKTISSQSLEQNAVIHF